MLARRQFNVLYRTFLLRIVDLEVLPARADPTSLLAQIGALLAGLSFTLSVIMIPSYSRENAERIALQSWGDQEFLIGTSMAIAGLFTVIAWDSISPDGRDSLVLGHLPVRTRTILRAKLAAAAAGLGLSLICVNIITGLAYPFAAGGIKTFFVYWAVTIAAGTFVFSALLALQGLAAVLLPQRLFLRASNALQVFVFFVLLAAYFLTPGPEEMQLTPGMPLPALVTRLPSFWFVGLFERWNGSKYHFFEPLGGRGLAALSISIFLACACYAFTYFRSMRRGIEEPGIAPSDHAHPRLFRNKLIRIATSRLAPVNRAVLLFIGRTMMRSRQHRNFLAVFGGLALAISLASGKAMLYGNSRMYAEAQHFGFVPPRWYQPNTTLLTAGFVLLGLAVIGTRAAFSLPVTLRANWILRLTAVHSPSAYFHATRQSMLVLAGLPVLTAASLFYLTVWSGPEAWGYTIVLWMVGVVLVNGVLTGFTKLPFACSYAPGQSNLRMKLPAYGLAFIFVVVVAANIERAMLETAGRAVLLGLFLTALLIHQRRRWRTFAGSPDSLPVQLRFEEEPGDEISPLRLSGDAGYGREYRYLDAINAAPKPNFRRRAIVLGVKSAAVVVSLCAAGALYERISEWRHPVPPRVGQPVDVGGRTLNYFCQGEGSPVVIFESGRGGPGIYWSRLQRDVAGYTRACWYDRAGYGWSDPAPFPHPASAIADDLHVLLTKANISAPYVLVGFSFGGLTSRVFVHRHPEGVAGMVLVDSSMVVPNETLEPPTGSYLPYFPRLLPAIASVAAPLGLVRLGMPPGSVTAFEPRTMVESLKEMDYESMLESLEVKSLGDLPLIVLTAGRHRMTPPDNPIDARRERVLEGNWIEGQRRLAQLSKRGEQRVFPDANHNLPLERPEEVRAAIREVVTRTRVRSLTVAAQ
jgi:pimeloyl-ACP methyl ester carboxylesterase